MNPVLENRVQTFTPKVLSDPSLKADPRKVDQESKIDFVNVLNNSNAGVREERRAKESGEQFSGKENYEEFLKRLEDQTQKKQLPRNSLDKDDFLKLFVEQLKNQDPLDPEKGAEMASKMAQFNSLEQMMNMNKSLDKMADGQTQTRNLDLVNYVGKEIKLAGGRLALAGDKVNPVDYEIGRDASEVEIEVRDSSGQVVHKKSLGGQSKGVYTFAWDGKSSVNKNLPDGTYSASFKVKDINSADIPVRMNTKTVISGIDLKDNDGGIYTPLGRIDLKDIEAIGSVDFDKHTGQAIKAKELNVNQQVPDVEQIPEEVMPAAIAQIQEQILRSQIEQGQVKQ